MISKFLCKLLSKTIQVLIQRLRLFVIGLIAFVIVGPILSFIAVKAYQYSDNDPTRGAIAIKNGAFGEVFSQPEYLYQGWDANDSLWFYNTTQGSALLPYDFFLALEQPSPKSEDDTTIPKRIRCVRNNKEGYWFLCPEYVDRFRYLAQKRTKFNPDALPVGFVKESYGKSNFLQNSWQIFNDSSEVKNYVGYTCAACHTSQINFKNPEEEIPRAIRIDGGPAMADMVTFLAMLTESMRQTQWDKSKLSSFIDTVIGLNKDYGEDDRGKIEKDLAKWTDRRELYNIVNTSSYTEGKTHKNIEVPYGYSRLDAFGRIFNRVLQHVINKDQVETALREATTMSGSPILNDAQVVQVMAEVLQKDNIILRDEEFWKILKKLLAVAKSDPNINEKDLLIIRDNIFNPANAPVSYPFLWDITRSDYVQWNGLASNAAAGPLGRNAGEVTGVFAILDWQEDKRLWSKILGLSLSSFASGQNKKKQIYFKSSADLFNLQRLEKHLDTLTSPAWPFCRGKNKDGQLEYYLSSGSADDESYERTCKGSDELIDKNAARRGQVIYAKNCQSCHTVIDPTAKDRLMIGQLLGIDKKLFSEKNNLDLERQITDEAMAENSRSYIGASGNIKDTYQSTAVGKVVVGTKAPVAQILTATTAGTVATSDADKWWPRRFVEWIYAISMTILDNPIKSSVKAGNYSADTTSKPYQSLGAYRARSLNGIWATAPYLHNGSVPSLYELLKCQEDRVKTFQVGSRVFDPVNVGFKSSGYKGFTFRTKTDEGKDLRGNSNKGHDYRCEDMSHMQRMDLIEYLKTLSDVRNSRAKSGGQ